MSMFLFRLSLVGWLDLSGVGVMCIPFTFPWRMLVQLLKCYSPDSFRVFCRWSLFAFELFARIATKPKRAKNYCKKHRTRLMIAVDSRYCDWSELHAFNVENKSTTNLATAYNLKMTEKIASEHQTTPTHPALCHGSLHPSIEICEAFAAAQCSVMYIVQIKQITFLAHWMLRIAVSTERREEIYLLFMFE